MQKSWTPMPGQSLDPRVHIPPDVYRFTQNQIESEQRQQQRNINRTITAGRQAPVASPKVKPPPQTGFAGTQTVFVRGAIKVY